MAIAFYGSTQLTDNISLGSNLGVLVGQPKVAVSMWVKRFALDSSAAPFFFYGVNGSLSGLSSYTPALGLALASFNQNPANLTIIVTPPVSSYFVYSFTTTTYPIIGDVAQGANSPWQHVVAQSDFSTGAVEVWVDGVLQLSNNTEVPGSVATNGTSDTSKLFSYANSSLPLNAGIDDYRLYLDFLSPEIISTIFSARGRDGINNNLINRYLFQPTGRSGVAPSGTRFPDLCNNQAALGQSSNSVMHYVDSELSVRRRVQCP
jgi:hypothetical protein